MDTRAYKIPLGNLSLEGNLTIPSEAKGLILFAHGSGSSRKSPRNRFVAEVLQKATLATLLIDLLTLEEEAVDEIDAHLRFDIPLLAQRLAQITTWLKKEKQTKSLKIGYFGASTGAAAALIASTEHPDIFAIVSRGGRPDLAKNFLLKVNAPTLLIVGGHDEQVIELNQSALEKMHCEKKLTLVPKATHLFEEPGALEEVARLAQEWFKKHL